ncbi:MAG: hypothetical protein IPJ65_02390 [Archangiaceae bacterium]|nr:hypothetical protein [Archangiaceae bacterium]
MISLALAALVLSADLQPSDLKWLQGSWRAVDADPRHKASSEEVWVMTEGGLVGLYRESVEGRPGFYELSTILLEGDAPRRLVLSSRMFDRALKDAKKTAGGPLRWVLEAAGFHKVTFKGEGANNKSTLVYELVNPHRLVVTLDRADGGPTERFDFSRFFL